MLFFKEQYIICFLIVKYSYVYILFSIYTSYCWVGIYSNSLFKYIFLIFLSFEIQQNNFKNIIGKDYVISSI